MKKARTMIRIDEIKYHLNSSHFNERPNIISFLMLVFPFQTVLYREHLRYVITLLRQFYSQMISFQKKIYIYIFANVMLRLTSLSKRDDMHLSEMIFCHVQSYPYCVQYQSQC